MDGGYDDGYRMCACFWGRQPGSLVTLLARHVKKMAGMRVLDFGCGDGKNAAYLAAQGCLVDAFDISEIAIERARAAWGRNGHIVWNCADVVHMTWSRDTYDIVVAYGLLHCLKSADTVTTALRGFQAATKPGGYNVIATFNDRKQDLSAHPTLQPCLLSHSRFLDYYSGWETLEASDTDLTEIHPHNNIQHTHAMTRLLMRRDPAT